MRHVICTYDQGYAAHVFFGHLVCSTFGSKHFPNSKPQLQELAALTTVGELHGVPPCLGFGFTPSTVNWLTRS